tara:strand:+ start:1646 stop:2083 length:438 start_codon:yes stop_codon:yes gene_type:complete
MIEIVINSKPIALKRHRVARFGRMYDPSAKDKKKTVQEIKKFKPDVKLKGPILIEYKFFYERPKSHYRTGKFSNILKDNAPKHHTNKPDLDNVIKYYNDVLQVDFIEDDSQIVCIWAVKKYNSESQVVIKLSENVRKNDWLEVAG